MKIVLHKSTILVKAVKVLGTVYDSNLNIEHDVKELMDDVFGKLHLSNVVSLEVTRCKQVFTLVFTKKEDCDDERYHSALRLICQCLAS